MLKFNLIGPLLAIAVLSGCHRSETTTVAVPPPHDLPRLNGPAPEAETCENTIPLDTMDVPLLKRAPWADPSLGLWRVKKIVMHLEDEEDLSSATVESTIDASDPAKSVHNVVCNKISSGLAKELFSAFTYEIDQKSGSYSKDINLTYVLQSGNSPANGYAHFSNTEEDDLSFPGHRSSRLNVDRIKIGNGFFFSSRIYKKTESEIEIRTETDKANYRFFSSAVYSKLVVAKKKIR